MQQQLAEMEKKPNAMAFKAAFVYAVFFLIMIYILKLIGINSTDPALGTGEKIIVAAVSYIPFILAIIYVQTNHKKELGGYITFGRAFSAGFKVAAYGGLFLAIVQILYFKVLDTAAFQDLMNKALEAAGDDENKVKGVEMMRSYMVFFIGFGTAITYTVFGLIVSLISAAVIKRERPLHQEGTF